MTRRRWPALAAVGVAAAIAYAPSFAVPFQYDDYARIGQNQALRDGRLLDALIWFGNSRIVPSLTLVLNFRLGGADPLGYHVVNFAAHLLTAFGVMALALALCRTPRLRAQWPPERAWRLAAAAGLVFACHPLQTQAVTYIIQRYASMAALFYVWGTVCFLRARCRRRGSEPGRAAPYFVATGVLGLCAVLSKENAVTFPVALLLVEWIGFGWPRHRRALAVGVGIALLAVLVPVVWKVAVAIPSRMRNRDLSLWTRFVWALVAPQGTPGEALPTMGAYLLTQATVLPRYLLLVVRPWGLNVDHDVPFVATLTPAVLGGFAGVAALLGLGLSQVRRRPMAAMAILWPLLTLSVESSILPIGDPMVEHRMYLPMAGVAIGVGALFAAAVDRAPRLARAAGAAIALALVVLTFGRNLVWQSPLTLWLDAAEKSPGKGRTHLNAGVAYHQLDRLDEAVGRYCRALELNPKDALAHDNLQIAIEALGVGATVKRPLGHGAFVLEVEDPSSFCARQAK